MKVYLLFAFILCLTLVTAFKITKHTNERSSHLFKEEDDIDNLSDEELLDAEEEEEDSDEEDEDFQHLDLNDDEEDNDNEDQDDFTEMEYGHKH